MANNRNKALQFLADEFQRVGQSPIVKAACAEAIGMIGGEKALQFLADEFQRVGQPPEVKVACAKGIGLAGAQEK